MERILVADRHGKRYRYDDGPILLAMRESAVRARRRRPAWARLDHS